VLIYETNNCPVIIITIIVCWYGVVVVVVIIEVDFDVVVVVVVSVIVAVDSRLNF